MSSLRFKFDITATLLHFVTVILAITNGSFVRSFPGACLTLMELVALVFHILYLTCYRGTPSVPRKIKWVEYGISATLGTIAVLHTNTKIRYDWIFLFLLIGTGQQLLGLLVDAKYELGFDTLWPAFIAGCSIQLGEYIFVAYAGDNYMNSVYWTYVAFYGLFGVHAFVGFWRKGSTDYMEEIYSFYGFVAKLAVFYAEYFYFAGVSSIAIGSFATGMYLLTILFTVIIVLANYIS